MTRIEVSTAVASPLVPQAGEGPAPNDGAVGPIVAPPASRTLAEAGLAEDRLARLVLKALYGGEASGSALAERLCLPFAAIEALLEAARRERLIEVRGAAGIGAAGYRYTLTDLGLDRARQFLAVSGYIGPAPVPLAQYVNFVRSAASRRRPVNRERVRAAFAHLVIGGAVVDQLGPAVNSGKALFLYGPPGNGKTVMAGGIGRLLGEDVYVPYAIDVDGHIITVFDPVTHEPHAEDDGSRGVVAAGAYDRRWVRVRRPVVMVGGELTLEMLDLTFNHVARSYDAPMQLKANGGVLVVDDFGRQRVAPADLLNRWIVPLESRVDYLTLHTGRKFEVPFDVFVVFATNLDPSRLADEAFLRRIPYKILAKNPTFGEFFSIFEMNCGRVGVPFDPGMVEYLYRRHYLPRGLELRACHPRDLIDQIVNLARYRDEPPRLTPEALDAACDGYFLASEAGSGEAPDFIERGRA